MAVIILCLWSPSPKHRYDLHRHRLDTLISNVASFSSRQLLIPLCDKVKQLHGVCISYNKATTIRLLPVADNLLHNMIISYNNVYHIMYWPYHITTCPAKTSSTSSPLLLQVLHGCYKHLARTILTYAKTTMVIYEVCCFNLLQGPATVKFDSTKVGETDTRQPPLCKTSCIYVGGTGLMYVNM